MPLISSNPRIPEYEVDALFYDRWSPRSFIDEPLPQQQIDALFEAARWSMSCNNEQPWLFIYASKPEERARFLPILTERNQLWAKKAPLLGFSCCRNKFAKSGKENRFALYDTGAAWMAIALQARKLGLYAHGMAGFDQEKAYEVLGVDKLEYTVIAAFVAGRHADPMELPEDFRALEKQNSRKLHCEVVREGHF